MSAHYLTLFATPGLVSNLEARDIRPRDLEDIYNTLACDPDDAYLKIDQNDSHNACISSVLGDYDLCDKDRFTISASTLKFEELIQTQIEHMRIWLNIAERAKSFNFVDINAAAQTSEESAIACEYAINTGALDSDKLIIYTAKTHKFLACIPLDAYNVHKYMYKHHIPNLAVSKTLMGDLLIA